MLLTAAELLHLPVLTKSGQMVGRVSGFEFEAETQTILRYEARSGWFRPTRLLIHRTQVISLDNQKMIIEDGAAPAAWKKTLAIRSEPEGKPATLTRK